METHVVTGTDLHHLAMYSWSISHMRQLQTSFKTHTPCIAW